MRGRNGSMRALELVKHCCCALNCTTRTQETNNVEKYPQLANVRCFPICQDNANKYYAAGMSERERHMWWIAACRLDSLNVTRHTRICSIHFEGVLGPTKLNPVPSIFSFPQHLHTKKLPSRARHLLNFFFIWQLNSTNERDLLIMLKRNNILLKFVAPRINTRTKQLQRVIQQKCDNNIDFYVTNSVTRLLLAFLLYIIEVKVKPTRSLKAWTFTNLVRRLFPNISRFLVYILPRMEVQTSPKAGTAKQNANCKPCAVF